LPDISGLDLCRTIRRIDKSTPIIFYSAAAFPRDLETGLLAGANAYLVKPDLDELVPTITQLLIESSATALRMAG
jgi:DNA-binding response OmpR family regulator